MNIFPRLTPVIGLLGLAACAVGPEVEVSGRGRLHAEAPHSFVIDNSGPADPHIQAASNAVAKALSARGWLAGATAPGVRIEALYAERPGSLGAFLGEAAPAEPGTWRINPTPRRWWRRDSRVGVLTVRIVDTATGKEIVRAEGKRRIDGRSARADLDQLAAAVVAEALAEDTASTALR